ncbi:MAG: hypothetical protein WBB55_09420, partial [Anaerolineales bacterium]
NRIHNLTRSWFLSRARVSLQWLSVAFPFSRVSSAVLRASTPRPPTFRPLIKSTLKATRPASLTTTGADG